MQYRNAYSPMLVTDLGIVTEVKFSQYENADFPMLATELPIVKDFNSSQPENILIIDIQLIMF